MLDGPVKNGLDISISKNLDSTGTGFPDFASANY
jgi:hypothetical protein